MAEIVSTRLRAFQSKDLETLLIAVSNLPFKIEIKAGPTFVKKMWIVFAVLPDDNTPILSKVPPIVDFD